MEIPNEGTLLRIFIGEADRWKHRPLYEAIVLAAREAGLAGATVLRGPMGFGKSSRLHTNKILRLSMDLPLVIEIIDGEQKISAFLPTLDQMVGGGLVTMEKVRVLQYRSQEPPVAGEKGQDITARIDLLIQQNQDTTATAQKVLEATLIHFASETGTIHRLEDAPALLQLVASIGLPPQLLEAVKTIPVGKGIAGQTVAQRKPVTICNLQTDTSGVARPAAKETGVGSAVCVPIWFGDKIIGTFGIGARRESEYTVEQTRQLEEIARRFGILLPH
jgi:PII-like signaling protein/putative methionine-R-sulfoxide reductase with GAF domain